MGPVRSGVVGALTAVVLAIVPATASADPATGGSGNRYVALGDSWAAGAAIGDAAPASGTCRRSPRAYPPLVARTAEQPAWISRACASSTGGAGQLTALSAATERVTATVGSDATGLGALAAACSSTGSTPGCDAALARFDRALAALPRALDASLAAIRARAPRASITVTGFPLLAEGRACATGPADGARAGRLDDAVSRLNDVLREHAAGYVDVRDAFAGHGVCATDPWLAPLTGRDPLLAGGATADGHARGFAPALARAPRSPTPDDRGRDPDADLAAPLFGG